MSFLKDMKKVHELLRGERAHYVVGLLCLLGVNVADASAPIFLAVALDLTEAALTQSEPLTPPLLSLFGVEASQFTIAMAVGLYLALMLSANVARYPMLMNTAVPSHRIGQRVRRRLASHLLRQAQPFYDRAKSGDLMSLATSDVSAVRMMMGPGILVGFDTFSLAGAVLLVMCAMSWELTLVALLPLPLIALVTNRLSHMEFNAFEAVQEDLATLTERTRESYAGIRIIQGYARESFDRDRFEQYSWRHYAKNLRLARVRALFEPSLDFLMGASIALVFGVGGWMVVREELTLGTFVAFLFLINFLSGPMIGFGWAVSLFQRGRASLGRLESFWDTEVAVTDAPGAIAHEGPGVIVARSLSFAYAAPKRVDADESGAAATAAARSDAPVEGPVEALHDVSFRLEAGQTLGVIGPVGSGKSTLARLLTRQYPPPPGALLLDGHDINALTLESLRRTVVLAPQDTFLFSDTVERNILMAAAPGARADTFTELAALHGELSALPEAYDTMLGERGVNLSGGQRQRLAIARAIATDPRVLILDDCLSAVDARTEEAILSNLRRVFEGRSGMIISHRVRAVQRCDQILVLDGGRVVERGTHSELVAQGGYYARIAAEQTGAAHDERAA